jgi:hypothetical protein
LTLPFDAPSAPLPPSHLLPQIWYLPEGKRAFSDPTQVEWIEDKTWARVLDEDWDITKVGGVWVLKWVCWAEVRR